ncbi:flavin reductase family protein [Fervidibacillus halotolerans]|uniref:Flavin reductase family protein n=1 Tax=Fervidibacillus halotolerans TaxID=2980027 RepID=A0A9E8RYU3_9BACI|nr:flavin reductase family protein [Fervidibacillus halotolerans]WAA13186.1 flavin reductase family protein [Fervidibacillus halotolerans]
MDQKAKKTALRGISYGLYIVGTKDDKGVVNGFTGNWLTQTSFEPPLVALAVKAGTRSQEQIAKAGVFSVNILETGKKDMATAFFKSVEPDGNKLAGYEFYTEETGCPIFNDALSFFECKVVDKIEKGDHFIYVGEVINAGVHREGDPMTLKETGFYYGG